MTYCFKFKAKHDEVVGCNFDGHERPVNTILVWAMTRFTASQ